MRTRLSVHFILFALLPGLAYQYVQDRLRGQIEASSSLAAWLGVAPNALGGLSLATSLAWLLARVLLPR
ncbi:MAG: hypothetical protein AAF449_22010 [Myxococcota bacterium]